MTTIRTAYKDDYNKYWPYADQEDELKEVVEYAEKKELVDVKKFTAAQTKAKKARDAAISNVLATKHLKAVTTDKLFATIKAGVFKNKKLPEVKEIDDMLAEMDKESDAYTKMKAYKSVLKKVTAEERKAFNDNLSEAINAAAAFSRSATNLDLEVKALVETINSDEDATKDLKNAAKLAMTPVEHRKNLSKVSKALSNLASESNEVEQSKLNDKTGGDTEDGDGDKPGKGEEAGGSAGAIIGAILGVLVVVGGVAWCKCNKKFCFEDKENADEGGETDKSVYKQEVKSKNSHKRHAKESLMPAFKVADDQA